jgi:cation:H+ antiporter
MTIWLQFGTCAAVILFAGSWLSHYGELIAEKSGLSKSSVGLILLAITTSLSQLVMSISSVVLHDLPNMAVSALIGSCMFNMMVIGLLDLLSLKKPVSRLVHKGHILSVGFGIVLVGLAAVDILFGKHLPVFTVIRSMDPITMAFVPIYALAIWLAFNFEKSRLKEYGQEQLKPKSRQQSWPKLIIFFLLCAIGIICASIYLPAAAEHIAKLTGWGESFIGSSFIAVVVCLPELTVSVSAARRGSFDMAVASLLGGNLCCIAILAITDFCYMKGPLLHHVSQMNVLAALSAIISMGIVVIALTYRSEKKFFFIAGDAVALILVYVFANALLFIAR